MENHYYSINQHYKRVYGHKVYKLALDIGGTCPNRDGLLAIGGCTFCLAGSGHFASRQDVDIKAQIQQAKDLLRNKVDLNTKYCAYFQSFTNTYGDLKHLREIFLETIHQEDIVSMSIGTRPDCLDDNVMDLLRELQNIKPISIELGLQTIHDKTAEAFNRGYKTEVFYETVEKLHASGIEIVVHLIFGLPGESKTDMLATVEALQALPIQGLKLQVLHILKGTKMAEEDVRLLEEEEWFQLLALLLPRIPEDVVIHRLTGDGPKEYLIGPLWTANKRQVRNHMEKYFRAHNVVQGSLVEGYRNRNKR